MVHCHLTIRFLKMIEIINKDKNIKLTIDKEEISILIQGISVLMYEYTGCEKKEIVRQWYEVHDKIAKFYNESFTTDEDVIYLIYDEDE